MMFFRIWLGLNSLIIFVSVVMYSAKASANIPDGFEDLFEEQQLTLKLVLSADKNKSFNLIALVAGDEIRIQTSQQAQVVEKLQVIFGIDEAVSHAIAESLVTGVQSSKECVGYRSECGLLPELYDFVYVPDSHSLIAHVNSLYLEEQREELELEFVRTETDHNSVIMSHGLNLSGSYSDTTDHTSAYSYQHENYIGFGKYGYIHNDLNYSDVNGFSSDDSSYNYAQGNTRFSVGYKYQERAWNSTQFLENNSKTSGYMLSVGSTRELVKKSTANSRRVYLNVPRAGRLEINDDRGRVLLSRNVNAGQDYFDYNELPVGTYTATIRIFDGSEEFYNEDRLIVNTASSALASGQVDYHITAGFLSRELTNTGLDESFDSNSISFAYDNYESPVFTNGKLSYQVTDFLAVGGGMFVTSTDNYNYVGGNLLLGEVSRLSAVTGLFDDGSSFYNVDFGLYDLSLSYTNFESEGGNLSDVSLSRLLFGNSSYMSLSMNYSRYLSRNVSSYISGILTRNQHKDLTNGYTNDSESWSARSGVQISSLPLDSKLSLELSASESSDINYGVMASVTIPLGLSNNYMHSTQARFDERGNSTLSHRDTVSSSIVNRDNLNVSSSAGLYYQDSEEDSNNADLSISANYKNKHMDTNSYVYVNSNSSANISAYIGTSNIITSEGIEFTSEKSSSYFIANNDTGNLSSDGKFLAVVNSERNGKQGNTYVSEDALNVYPLKEYKEYEFELDTEASDFYNNGESYISATSYPGTIIRLDTSLSELKSFISTFSDINGSPIDGVECIGDGCVSTDRLVEGVYQFKVKNKLPYKIISKTNQCVIPELSSVNNLNLGNNFCMPTFEENSEGYQIALVDGIYYYYLGQYKDSNVVLNYQNKLSESGVEIINKRLGEYSYIFAKSTDLLTTANKVFVNELINYAVHMELTPYASN
ncbi:CS1-pili formation C-terminal domain-containing protein [Vibrio sp. ZF 223]|uniref:CS1-pili formation C-terminal domain-containing protein n=1 Tax=Vibrio sp. ZF 223 TaxID=2056191 RepID=UPI002158E9F8|nr:CS1-pili formation C-terminal domain-containing protein [Vibrio sp. ZF 223]